MQNKIGFILFSFVFLAGSTAGNNPADPALFNLGRFKIFRGFSFSADQKTIYFDSYVLAPYSGVGRSKLYRAHWARGQWSQPELLDFLPGDTHHTPVLSPDGKRLYFTSSAPAPGEIAESDQNIWYVDWDGTHWGAPVYLQEVNTDANERVTSVSENGDLYFSSNRPGGMGNSDIYYCSKTAQGFSPPQNLAVFNSASEETALAIDPQRRYALLQRRTNAYTVDLFVSFYDGANWSVLLPLAYKRNYPQATASYYSPRFTYVAAGGNTLYFNINFLPYYASVSALFEANGIISKKLNFKKEKPLAIAKRKYGESVPFAANQLQTNNGFRLAPDQKTAYVSQYTPPFFDEQVPGDQRMIILESHLKNGNWSPLQPVSFGDPAATLEYHPVLSPDGRRLFFNSRSNKPGTVPHNNEQDKNNLFYVDKQPDGRWGPRHFIAELATENADEDYGSQAADGTLYFHTDRPDGKDDGEIYKSEYIDGRFSRPERIPELSSGDSEGNVFIDPRERFIIFIRSMVDTRNLHEVDLYISFKTGNSWTKPRPLDQINTKNNWELTPSVSADGKYFYFELTQNIMQVEFESLLLPQEKELLRNFFN